MATKTTIDRVAASAPESEPFTRADYAQQPEGFRVFLLHGRLVREATPTRGHQAIVVRLAVRAAHVAPDRVLPGPADVVIDDLNVLQPDVMVLGEGIDPSTADPETVPVLVMEVLSPGTARRDREVKTGLYLQAGVSEVWLVDPATVSIDIVTRSGVRHHGPDEVAESRVVTDPAFTAREVVGAQC